jgi:hypothetical protein
MPDTKHLRNSNTLSLTHGKGRKSKTSARRCRRTRSRSFWILAREACLAIRQTEHRQEWRAEHPHRIPTLSRSNSRCVFENSSNFTIRVTIYGRDGGSTDWQGLVVVRGRARSARASKWRGVVRMARRPPVLRGLAGPDFAQITRSDMNE